MTLIKYISCVVLNNFKGELMKNSHIKYLGLIFFCLFYVTTINLSQAGVQPSVTVKTYAQHVGNNIVYNYRVTNNGSKPLTKINIGCICPEDFTGNSPDNRPQLIIYPIDYVFTPAASAGVSAGSYSAPAGWEGHMAGYDETGYFSMVFQPPYESDISLLPGQTGTFSITTPKVDKRGDFIGTYAMHPKGAAYFYDLNRKGYLLGNFSYFDEDIDGKRKELSYPMQLIDQTPPSLTVTLTPNTLWSPKEKLVTITATITVKDDYDPQPEVKLESITANEVLEKEDIKGAQFGTDDRQFLLKAEREGRSKAGRIYTVTYSATDASGNKSSVSATVTVPHDEREHEGSDKKRDRHDDKDKNDGNRSR